MKTSGDRAGRSAPDHATVESAGTNAWSEWQTLAGVPAISADVLAETLDGGQAFRWNRQIDGTWLGLWSTHVVRLRLGADERVQWSAPAAFASSTPSALAGYLATDRDFAALTDTLPWRSDPHLARCLVTFSGLRILRQPFGETLLGFLCSATKQIVQIKQMLTLLAERVTVTDSKGEPVDVQALSTPPDEDGGDGSAEDADGEGDGDGEASETGAGS